MLDKFEKITIQLHWPHDKCSIGWEINYPDQEYITHEIKLSLLIITFILEF